MPYIGEIKDNLYIGVGYNMCGMTNVVLVAIIISNDILNIENEYKEVFKLNGINEKVIMKLLIYIFNSVKS